MTDDGPVLDRTPEIGAAEEAISCWKRTGVQAGIRKGRRTPGGLGSGAVVYDGFF